MFLREKTSKNSKKPVLQLVDSHRVGDKVKQRIIVSLGTDFVVAKELRRKVSQAVKQRLLGQSTLIDDPQVTVIVDRIIKKIQTDGKWDSTRKQVKQFKEEDKDKVAEIFIDDVEHGNDRIVGPLLIGHTFWNRLGLPGILAGCDFRDSHIKTAEISVLNRLIDPGSEHAIPAWIRTAAVEDLIDKNAEQHADDRFYRVSDLLLKHQESIESKLYAREKSLFQLDNAIYLYDLTNTYFEGLCQKNPKAEFNKNQKEKRSDCRQIVVALVLDGEGFIRRHRIFNGKMTDLKSLEPILKILEDDFKNSEMPTIIMDRGVVSEDNIKLLKSLELKYIVAARSGEENNFIDDFKNAEFKVLKSDPNNQVEVFLRKDGEETFLLCKSTGRKKKENAMRNRAEKRLEQDITGLSKLIQNGKRNNPLMVERMIGRMKEKHNKAAYYYDIEYTPFSFDYKVSDEAKTPKHLLRSLRILKEKADAYKIHYINVKSVLHTLAEKYPEAFANVTVTVKEPVLVAEPVDEKKEKQQALDGNYLLKTNRDDLKDDEIWNMYVMLTRVEKAFRDLKTEIKLQPNYHQKEFRVEGHVFIAILAYHLLHSIEYTLLNKQCHSCWATVKRLVTSHTYSTIILPTTRGAVIHLRKPGMPEAVQVELYEKLNVNFKELPVRTVLA